MGKIYKIIMISGIIFMLIAYMGLGFYHDWKNEQRYNELEIQLQATTEKRDQMYLEMKKLEYLKNSLAAELIKEKEKARQQEIIDALAAINSGLAADKPTVTTFEPLPQPIPAPQPSANLIAAQERTAQRQAARKTRAS